MSHWLAQVGDTQSQMIGAFIISVPWNCFHSTNSLEKPLNWLLFNRHLTQKLLKMLQRFVPIELSASAAHDEWHLFCSNTFLKYFILLLKLDILLLFCLLNSSLSTDIGLLVISW